MIPLEPIVVSARLLVSQLYYIGWFEKLSEKFLSVKAGKLLVLAGTDRLDKVLTIGQMQGRCSNRVSSRWHAHMCNLTQ
jgi:hypothetical protein